MMEYFVWLTLGIILGYTMGLRQVRHYFGGFDPIDILQRDVSYLKKGDDDDAKKR